MTFVRHSINLKLIIIFSILLSVCTLFVQISFGAYNVTNILNGLFNSDILQTTYIPNAIFGETICRWFNIEKFDPQLISVDSLIIWNIRIPRLVVGLCVGINLAIAGCILQAITRNEMASSYTLGISQGSGLGILMVLVLFPNMYDLIPLFALFGGILSFLTVYAIAWKRGTSPIRLVLAGIIFGSIAIAIQRGLFYFVQDVQIFQDSLSWTTGSLIGTSWEHVRMIFPFTLLIIVASLILHQPLNLLLLGDNNAKSLGIAVEKWRFLLAFIGILAASSAVSVAGLIGFIGLIAPHICRTLVGYSHKQLFIANIFIGSTLMIISDTISRIILKGSQIPVGIVLNTIGGIFFMFLMRKHDKFGKL